MIWLDGKKLSQLKQKDLEKRIKTLPHPPHLAVVLVEGHDASEVYVAHKIKACEKLSIKHSLVRLKSSISEKELLLEIEKLNNHPEVHGILLQLPLPFDSSKALNALSPLKDVDGLTYENQAHLWLGMPRIRPCTPYGILKLLKHFEVALKGKKAVVVGRSVIVGKPMAALLLHEGATVTICHSQTQDLRHHTKDADVVIVSVGKKKLLDKTYFNSHATVVDVGIHTVGETSEGKKKICGDVDKEGLNVKALTPVPGGVGPMTIYQLLENTVELFEQGLKKKATK